MSSNSIYSAGTLRVAHKAAGLGISLPSDIWQPARGPDGTEHQLKTICHTRLGSALLYHIEDPNIRYVFRLVHSIHAPPDWYSIEYSDLCELERYDDIECAHDRAFAIQHIQELAEREGVKLTEEFCADGSIRFFGGTSLLVTLAPMDFSVADELLVRKAKSILKQLTSIHDEHCLSRMFSPLLASSSLPSGCGEKHDELRQYAIHSTLGNLASSMQRAMARLNVSISRGHSQELLAAFFNFTSWNHMRAIERACGGISINPAVVVDHRQGKPLIYYFKDDSSALAYISTVILKGQAVSVETNSNYGTLNIRQPPRGEYAFDSWPLSDSEDNALVMHTLMQVDRYELDRLIPLNQPDNFVISRHQ